MRLGITPTRMWRERPRICRPANTIHSQSASTDLLGIAEHAYEVVAKLS